jgi:hypothetical protein
MTHEEVARVRGRHLGGYPTRGAVPRRHSASAFSGDRSVLVLGEERAQPAVRLVLP